MMNNCYRKINLKPNVQNEIVKILRAVDEIVAADDPDSAAGDYWGLCEYRSAEIVSKFNLETHVDSFRILNSTFNSVVNRFPKFLDFLNSFKLHYYLGKPITGNWGIHKHGYQLDTWTWTIFANNSNNTTVGFHTPLRGAESYGPITESYFYDHLENNREVTLDHSISINDGDMYAFNAWHWHSYTVPQNINPNVYLLYFKTDKNYSIDHIINYTEQMDF